MQLLKTCFACAALLLIVAAGVNLAPTPVSGEDIKTVRIADTPVPVALARPTLVHAGQPFALEPNPNIAFEMAVPSDVVLTDAS